jgi:pimeloyl-ACP methyl ester carboxylesterase
MTAQFFSSFPAADERFTVTVSDGAILPVYRLAGPAGAPALLFGHANGLAAGSYAPWFARLTRRVAVFAFDARGHGGAVWPAGPLEDVFADDRMAEDVAEVTRAVAARLDGRPLAYVGHSLGGAAALRLLSIGGTPGWSRLVIFEPPILPPAASPVHAEAIEKQKRLIEGAARRRADWDSPEALYRRLQPLGMFKHFEDEMLMAHCRATLKPKPDGGYRLACPPEVESMIFRRHRAADTWSRLQRVTMPVELISGDPKSPDNDWISAAMPEIAAHLPDARLAMVEGTGHMPMFERSALCAEMVLERIASW